LLSAHRLYSVTHKSHSHCVGVLPTTVKRDRHAANSRLATVGDVDVTGVRHADATGIACELVRFPDKSQARALLKWSVASICPECANTSVSVSSKPTHGNGVHVSGFMQLYTAVHALPCAQ
jgi:hypothetical protein